MKPNQPHLDGGFTNAEVLAEEEVSGFHGWLEDHGSCNAGTPSAMGGSSFPDDQSLWPSFLSGRKLPSPLPVSDSTKAAQPIFSSVPPGPWIHDYVLSSTSVSGLT